MNQYRIGIIGYGAIGQVVVDAIKSTHDTAAVVVVVLVRDFAKYTTQAVKLNESGIVLTNDVDAFFCFSPDMVVEAAGQEAVLQYGKQVLDAGIDFMVTSIGAFTDDDLYLELCQKARKGSSNLYLAAGALPGVGWMQGASSADVYQVEITQSKPVLSWVGTPAEEMVNLYDLKSPTCFFRGTAREAAGIFRKSSNITAMLALATVGLDRVQVALVADPVTDNMQTLVDFNGEAGQLMLQWKGQPSILNPSTSRDVALNVIKAINTICSSVKLGV